MTSANRIPYLQTKKADLVISTLGKNPEREKVIDFTAAYSPFFQAVFAAKSMSIKSAADLAGKTVGFFSNNKPNASVVLERLEELLRARFGIVARRYLKAVPSLGADAPLLDEIRRDCHAVLVAGFD